MVYVDSLFYLSSSFSSLAFEAFLQLIERPRGRVVRPSDLKSGHCGFKSRSDHLAGLYFVNISLCLYMAKWTTSCQFAFLSLLGLFKSLFS